MSLGLTQQTAPVYPASGFESKLHHSVTLCELEQVPEFYLSSLCFGFFFSKMGIIIIIAITSLKVLLKR